jgi:hypothetical protein
MANLNNTSLTPGEISTTNSHLLGLGYKLPVGFQNDRSPGEITRLFTENHGLIYSGASAKTANSGLLSFGPRQPFITVNIDDAGKGINRIRKYDSRAFPIGSSIRDIERITKWSVTGNGIIFLGKQLMLQGYNAYNETKIYNPAMPIVAVASKGSLGLITPPTRHIEPSLGGVLGALGLGRVASAFNKDKPNAPSGTVAKTNPTALPSNASDGVKGTLRGATATSGYNNLISKVQSSKAPSKFNLTNYFRSSTLFGAFMPVGQPKGTIYRADEGSYGMYLNSNKFQAPTGINIQSGEKSVYQVWFGGSKGKAETRKGNDSDTSPVRARLFRSAKRYPILISLSGEMRGTSIFPFPKLDGNEVGSKIENRDGETNKYGNSVGAKVEVDAGFKNSEMLVNLAYYSKEDEKFPTKFSDPASIEVDLIRKNLESVVNRLARKNDVYEVDPTYVASPQFAYDKIGYDYLSGYTRNKDSVGKNEYNGIAAGYLSRFKGRRTVDSIGQPDSNNKLNIGFAGTHTADKINLLEPLSVDEMSEYDPKYDSYRSDIIAFFFEDVVNGKFIPFRATVKGITEGMNAEWNDVSYIGRADKLYSYKGFSRNLSFSFTVHVSSISELLPTWKRISYLCSLVKPSNYTRGMASESVSSRFAIPPIMNITIGDLYKNQPCFMTNISMTIPDDATWETFGEDGGNVEDVATKDWTYLHSVIRFKDSFGKYAQLPLTAEFNLTLNLIEKEKAIAGGAQFGDAYRDIDLHESSLVGSGPFSKKLITQL